MGESARLLPPSINDAHGRAIAGLVDRLAALDPAVVLTTDIDRVDASVLPHLVREMRLEPFVDSATPEATVRALLKQAVALHRHRGTPWAVEQVLAAAGLVADVVEWHGMDPPGPRHTFQVTAYVADNLTGDATLLTDERLAAAVRMVRWARRRSQHFTFRLGAGVAGRLGLATVAAISALTRLRLRLAAPARTPVALGLGLAVAPAAVTTLRLDL